LVFYHDMAVTESRAEHANLLQQCLAVQGSGRAGEMHYKVGRQQLGVGGFEETARNGFVLRLAGCHGKILLWVIKAVNYPVAERLLCNRPRRDGRRFCKLALF